MLILKFRSGVPSYDPAGIGIGDLDPLRAGNPGAGGMIFDPFRGGGIGRMPPRLPGGLQPGGFLPP